MSDASILTRLATADDAGRIADIYNQGIEDRQATLETELRTAEERRAWLASHDERHPVLVAEAGAEICGWASLNLFNARAAYQHVSEISVYVAREWRGRGVGYHLLQALEEHARRLGYHKLVLGGFPFNEAAVRLYTRSGFQHVGVYHEQGMLDGRWVDVMLMEKVLT